MAGRAQIEESDREKIPNVYLWNIQEKKREAATPPYNRDLPSRKGLDMQRLNIGPSFSKKYTEEPSTNV